VHGKIKIQVVVEKRHWHVECDNRTTSITQLGVHLISFFLLKPE